MALNSGIASDNRPLTGEQSKDWTQNTFSCDLISCC